MAYPPFHPDLAPSYFHLFGPIKQHLGLRKFTGDGKLMHDVRQLLWSTSFYTADTVDLLILIFILIYHHGGINVFHLDMNTVKNTTSFVKVQ